MRVLSRNRCLTFNPETRPLRQHRPADGIFCPSHAWDFRCDEAAKVATSAVKVAQRTNATVAKLGDSSDGGPDWRPVVLARSGRFS